VGRFRMEGSRDQEIQAGETGAEEGDTARRQETTEL